MAKAKTTPPKPRKKPAPPKRDWSKNVVLIVFAISLAIIAGNPSLTSFFIELSIESKEVREEKAYLQKYSTAYEYMRIGDTTLTVFRTHDPMVLNYKRTYRVWEVNVLREHMEDWLMNPPRNVSPDNDGKNFKKL